MSCSSGGEGYDDPVERASQPVFSDVVNQYISNEVTREFCGVVVDVKAMKIDYQSTKKQAEDEVKKNFIGCENIEVRNI